MGGKLRNGSSSSGVGDMNWIDLAHSVVKGVFFKVTMNLRVP
jgi:hypothetical protein